MVMSLYVVKASTSKSGNTLIHVGWAGKPAGELGFMTLDPILAGCFQPGQRLDGDFTLGEKSPSTYVDPADGSTKSIVWVSVELTGNMTVSAATGVIAADRVKFM